MLQATQTPRRLLYRPVAQVVLVIPEPPPLTLVQTATPTLLRTQLVHVERMVEQSTQRFVTLRYCVLKHGAVVLTCVVFVLSKHIQLFYGPRVQVLQPVICEMQDTQVPAEFT